MGEGIGSHFNSRIFTAQESPVTSLLLQRIQEKKEGIYGRSHGIFLGDWKDISQGEDNYAVSGIIGIGGRGSVTVMEGREYGSNRVGVKISINLVKGKR